MALSIFTVACDCHCYPSSELFNFWNENITVIKISYLCSLLLVTSFLLSVSVNLHRYLIETESHNICAFVSGLLLLACIFSVHMVTWIRISFLFMAEYSIPCMCHILCMYLSVGRRLSCFYLPALVNSATTNMGVQVSESLLLIPQRTCWATWQSG